MIGKKELGETAVLFASIVLLVPVCLAVTPALGQIYYVSTDGSDSNPGTSPKLAWQTIAYAARKAQAGVKIVSWTNSKTQSHKRMFLVQQGEKVVFTVEAEGASDYEWQVNKAVHDEATGDTFAWTVPNEKGIWEIHLKVIGGGGEAHQEWVVSMLSKKEAPDFFDYFADITK
jgi:hypothetical protein